MEITRTYTFSGTEEALHKQLDPSLPDGTHILPGGVRVVVTTEVAPWSLGSKCTFMGGLTDTPSRRP